MNEEFLHLYSMRMTSTAGRAQKKKPTEQVQFLSVKYQKKGHM